jgi:hypothetical protein
LISPADNLRNLRLKSAIELDLLVQKHENRLGRFARKSARMIANRNAPENHGEFLTADYADGRRSRPEEKQGIGLSGISAIWYLSHLCNLR